MSSPENWAAAANAKQEASPAAIGAVWIAYAGNQALPELGRRQMIRRVKTAT